MLDLLKKYNNTARVAANLVTNVRSAIIDLPVTLLQCWSDSSVAYTEFREMDYKQFVTNRATKIRAHNQVQWRHVLIAENLNLLASSIGCGVQCCFFLTSLAYFPSQTSFSFINSGQISLIVKLPSLCFVTLKCSCIRNWYTK